MAVTVPTRDETLSGRIFLASALLLLIGAAALRIYHIGERSLWYDEAVTAIISRGPVADVLTKTQNVSSAPIVHPYILYLAEKMGNGPVAARAPSALASFFAVVMMLMMARAGISHVASLIAASILAFSASEIRYAQEVREYSLTVLCATVLIYCLLRWEAKGSGKGHPLSLYIALFIAPLIQYGLVFLAFAILGTMLFRLVFNRDSSFKILHVAIAIGSVALGAWSTFILTLRYQIHPGKVPWYIAQNYFDPRSHGLLGFLGTNTKQLVEFVIPGRVAYLCFLLAAFVYILLQAIRKKVSTVTVLLFASLAVISGAALARLYPYGGVRQCLFLAPGLALFLGVALAEVLQRIKPPFQMSVTAVVLAVVVISLFRGTMKQWPYGEVEDTQSILRYLEDNSSPGDQVWVNHDAVPAFDFYLPTRDPRFVYGVFHADAKDYIPELFSLIRPDTSRVWLVFSHLSQASDRGEEQLIVSSMSSGWDVRRVVAAQNAELYVAERRTPAKYPATPASTQSRIVVPELQKLHSHALKAAI